ncbi:MAG: ATP-binding protein [Desulfobulbaceae bacterium]|nr:ATP-binding protein [Desulfobulbaceae bacterium]
MILPWWPVVWVDIVGSALSLLIGFWCIGYSWSWYREQEDDAFRHYLLLLTISIATFTISRSFGHIVKQFLLHTDQREVWSAISPFSGAANTATFILIFAFGIYFDRIRKIKDQADNDAVAVAMARTAADAALESEVRIRSIFDGVEDAIYLVDDDYKVLFFNRKMKELLPGISIEQKCYEALFNREAPCDDCRFHGLHSGENFSYETELELISKKVNITGIRLTWVDQREVNLAVIRDITEQKRLEEQFLQSQKLEAVGTLAGGIAHDFNNLLTAIIGYSDIIMIGLDDQNAMRDDVGEIRRAAGRAAVLVRQLLAFSRKQKGVLAVIEVNQLIGNMQKMLDRLIGEDISMDIQLATDKLLVRVDPGQIEQVAVNLVVNSRDAMPDGGNIFISTEEVVVDAQLCLRHPGAKPGRFVLMTIRDEGVGMDKELVSKVFEPFYTTKEVGKGSGLGLAVVYGIIEQHNGWIELSSEVGKGTEFKVYLPLYDGVEKAKTRKEKGDIPLGAGERILLVEDQPEVMKVAVSMLEQNGYKVVTAASLAEAEEVFAREKDSIDLLFSDIVLPDGSGIMLEERFRALRPDLPVLMSSGYADDKMQWSLIQKRNLPFLQKPYTLEALLRSVSQVLSSPKD